MNRESNPHIMFFLRIWIGLIFAYAGFSKLMEPIENFRGMLAEYQVIPYSFLTIVSLTVPWMEFLFGIFMLLGFILPLTSAALAFLCLCFLLVIGSSSMLLDNAGSNCGCFGQNGPIHLAVWQVFIMDFINLIIAGKIFLQKKALWSLDGLLAPKRQA